MAKQARFSFSLPEVKGPEKESCSDVLSSWYAVRTKRYKERFVARATSLFADDVYLPLIHAKRRCLGAYIDVIEPFFPCYLFVRFVFERMQYTLEHSPGVAGIVSAGKEPCAVHPSIIEEIRSREQDGIIRLNPKKLQPRVRVTVSAGFFRGIEAVFERYLSGTERAAILLDTIGGANIRAVVRSASISALPGR